MPLAEQTGIPGTPEAHFPADQHASEIFGVELKTNAAQGYVEEVDFKLRTVAGVEQYFS